MLKILLALPRPLFPADFGGRIRTLNIFARLAKRAEIHTVSLADPDTDATAITKMRQIFHSYTPIYWREASKYSLSFYAGLLANRFSRLPYTVAKYQLSRFRTAAEELASRERLDVALCDFLPPAAALLGSTIRPRVLFAHNVEGLLRKRWWATEEDPLRKWVFGAEWSKTRNIEARVCQSFDHVITVSEDDAWAIRREYGIDHVSTIPTGVDTEFFRPLEVQPDQGHLVFVGSMDWYPNEDGVIWFLEEVYPRLRKERAQVSLTVVGRNPSARLLNYAAREPGVEITGRVEDVRPYLAQASVVVVPLRVGGGTRIKIPEAIAMAKPVVSTTVGAEGLPLIPGREILVADGPEEFARNVADLLNDPLRRETLARVGREKVVRECSWDIAAKMVEEVLEQQAESAKAAPAGFSNGTPGRDC